MLLSRQEREQLARRRFQSPELRQTGGAKPKWYCRYYKDVRDVTGAIRRVEAREYFGFVSQVKPVAAKRLHAAFVEKLNRGAFGVEAEATIGEWIDEWWPMHRCLLKESSRGLYAKHIDNHIRPFLGALKFGDLNQRAIQQWVAHLVGKGLATSTRRGVVAVLQAVISGAIDAGLYSGPPLFRKLKLGPEKRVHDRRIWTPEQFRTILSLLEPETKAMALVATVTGLRVGEIMGLRWRDCDFARGILYIRQRLYLGDLDSPKRGEREVSMGGLGPTLEALPRLAERIFRGSEHTYHSRLKAAIRKAKCDFPGARWHTLRRSFATWAKEYGADIVDVSRTLGHQSIQQTEDYIIGVAPLADLQQHLLASLTEKIQ